MENLKTNAEVTWCSGCGNFGIFTAVRNAIPKLEAKGIKRNDIVADTYFIFIFYQALPRIHKQPAKNSQE